jgi:Tfp pilus assembly protein PilX
MTSCKFPAVRTGNEEGSILIFTLLVMLVLTIIGLAASTTTEIELKVTTNDTQNKKAFSAADAGISYGISKTSLYDDSNTDPDTPVTESQSPTNDLSFSVTATYVAGTTGGSFARGSGFSATGKTKFHVYQFDSEGSSSGNATCDVSAKGYRIGL